MEVSRTCCDCGGTYPWRQSRRCGTCVYLRKKAKVDEWKTANQDRVRELGRRSRYNRFGPARDAAVAALGGRCARCGFDDERALDIDHVNGGGTAERRLQDRIGFFKEIAAGGRSDVQLLCLNCHRIKTHEDHLAR